MADERLTTDQTQESWRRTASMMTAVYSDGKRSLPSTAIEKESPKSSSRRRPLNVLIFSKLEEQPNVARCQLVLCNISERVLHFQMKSSSGSGVVSAPVGNGHIGPRSQIRLLLTWTRAEEHRTWQTVPSPKLILTTRFVDVRQEAELTHTRLVAKLGRKTCLGANPPVEQLLLDATKALQEKRLDEEPRASSARQEANLGQSLADLLNNLSDRGICVLILLLAICLLAFIGK